MDVALRLGGERIFVWFVIFLGLLAAAAFGFLVGEDSVKTVIVLASSIAILGWIALARRRWWLIVPAASSIGGYFYFGAKVYPHEVALLAAFVPLGLAIAVRLPGTLQKRQTRFPLAMYVLSAYLFAHWIGSIVYNRVNGEGGFGNVSRGYLNALWVILFLIAFWRYGSSRSVPAALFISYLVAFGRLLVGAITYYSSAFAYIPVLNYILPGSTHTRGADLRSSALSLGTLAACYFLIHKGFLKKGFHGLVFVASLVGLLFAAGRGVLVLLCLVPIFIALLYRRVVPLILSVFVIASVVAVLNLNTSIMNGLPYPVQRSVSVVLFDKDKADSYARTASSDLWHERLREIGLQKWTQNWNTFFFGTGLRPTVITQQDTASLEEGMASAARIGSYESSFWTITAVTGLVGLLLYVSVFFYLLRRLLPILLREGIKDHRHGFAFMSVFGIVLWFALGWAQGGFPTSELLFGFLALSAFQDQQERQRQIAPIRATKPIPLPRRQQALQLTRR